MFEPESNNLEPFDTGSVRTGTLFKFSVCQPPPAYISMLQDYYM